MASEKRRLDELAALRALFTPGSRWKLRNGSTVLEVTARGPYFNYGRSVYVRCRVVSSDGGHSVGYEDGWAPDYLTFLHDAPKDENMHVNALTKEVEDLRQKLAAARDERNNARLERERALADALRRSRERDEARRELEALRVTIRNARETIAGAIADVLDG